MFDLAYVQCIKPSSTGINDILNPYRDPGSI